MAVRRGCLSAAVPTFANRGHHAGHWPESVRKTEDTRCASRPNEAARPELPSALVARERPAECGRPREWHPLKMVPVRHNSAPGSYCDPTCGSAVRIELAKYLPEDLAGLLNDGGRLLKSPAQRPTRVRTCAVMADLEEWTAGFGIPKGDVVDGIRTPVVAILCCATSGRGGSTGVLGQRFFLVRRPTFLATRLVLLLFL